MAVSGRASGFAGDRWRDVFLLDVAVVALILSTLSRLLVAFFGLPAAVNFLHFPAVVGLFLFSLRRVGRLAAPIYAGCGGLFFVYVLSAVVNGAGAVNAVLGFSILAEPFLLFAVLLDVELDSRSIRRLRGWLVALAVVQIPIAFAQWPRALAENNADLVQGTFTGMVAGHHILGGVAMVGALYVLAASGTRAVRMRWTLAAPLFAIVVISDTKQVMLAFLAGYVVLRALRVRNAAQASKFAIRAGALVVGIYVAQWLVGTQGYFYHAQTVLAGFAGKFVVFPILSGHFDSIWNWLFGVGPGHGVARLGGWLLEKYWHVLAPLGATRTGIPAQVWGASGPLGDRSSFFIPLFSWAGIFGDVGLGGILVYGALLWTTFRRFCVDDTCRVMVISIVCLGFMFEWLEEPNFMLYAMAVIAQRWRESSAAPGEQPLAATRSANGSLRVAWLLPTGGVHWYPVLVELGKRFPRLKVFTARASFAQELGRDVDVEVVGRARVFGEEPVAPGYRAKLTWASPKILVRLCRFRAALVFTNSFGLWTMIAVLLEPLMHWRVVVAYEGSAPGVDFRDSHARLLLRRAIVRWADACITNTEVGRQYLTDVLGARPERVAARPYLVPTEQFFDFESDDWRRRLSALERPQFLYVGRLTARKGVRQLLQACAHLDAAGLARYSLVIVGDGPLRRDLESLATSLGVGRHVLWVGRVPHAAVGAYLRACDVLVLPTWEDTWGMTVPEALLAGKPVLCSVRAGAVELVEDGKNGYRFDPIDPKSLADRMRRFADRPELISEMGKRSREVIAEHTPAAAGEFLATVACRVLRGTAVQ